VVNKRGRADKKKETNESKTSEGKGKMQDWGTLIKGPGKGSKRHTKGVGRKFLGGFFGEDFFGGGGVGGDFVGGGLWLGGWVFERFGGGFGGRRVGGFFGRWGVGRGFFLRSPKRPAPQENRNETKKKKRSEEPEAGKRATTQRKTERLWPKFGFRKSPRERGEDFVKRIRRKKEPRRAKASTQEKRERNGTAG